MPALAQRSSVPELHAPACAVVATSLPWLPAWVVSREWSPRPRAVLPTSQFTLLRAKPPKGGDAESRSFDGRSRDRHASRAASEPTRSVPRRLLSLWLG